MRDEELTGNELSDSEIFMIAAESAIRTIFAEADDDREYHHDVNTFRNVNDIKKLRANSTDVAESILGWTIAL